MTLVCQDKSILDTTAALQNIGIVWRRVSFADDIRTSKLELLGKSRSAAPLDILVAVGGALVGAAHDVRLIELADVLASDALQLGHGGHTTVRRHGAIAAERQGLDLGEQNRILGTGGCMAEKREGE